VKKEVQLAVERSEAHRTIQRLVSRAAAISDQDNFEVIEQGVRLLLAWYGDNPDWPKKAQVRLGSEDNDPISPTSVLEAAHRLSSTCAFTLDELLASVYGSEVFIWEAKAVKNRIATLLRAAGYECKQKRRGGTRVLAWGLPAGLQHQVLLARART
tara:strand:+ start:515 stop:982 length:468 start_codon:yes stop_codon:yes gene_type:complete